MSGLVCWSSRAKNKGVNRTTGPVNAHRLRANASKHRKLRARIEKDAEKARKAATAAAVAAMNS